MHTCTVWLTIALDDYQRPWPRLTRTLTFPALPAAGESLHLSPVDRLTLERAWHVSEDDTVKVRLLASDTLLVKLQQNRATEFLNPTPPLSEAEIDERVYHWQQLGFTLVGELSREQFA